VSVWGILILVGLVPAALLIGAFVMTPLLSYYGS
jgi:hypothetical protein